MEMATDKEMTDLATLERFVLALRFHGDEARAEQVEQRTEQMRAEIWARLGKHDEQISATQSPKTRTRHPEAAAQGYTEASRRGALDRNPAAFGARPAAGH